MKVILISGKAQHGKDSFANFLKEAIEEDEKKCLIVHMADTLKLYAKLYFGWNGEKDTEGRELLQRLGTDFIEQENKPLFWVEEVDRLLELVSKQYDYVLIPDIRFKKEVDFFLNIWDALPIRIERENFYNTLTLEQKNHKSEIDLDNYVFDYYISNSKTLDYLKTIATYFYPFIKKEERI